jgi:hypothetical protein
MHDRQDPSETEPGGVDAVALAAVLDGAGPPAGSDAAARAAHERAAADVKLLARMLGLIGDSLAESGSDEKSGVSVVPGASVGTDRQDIDSADPGGASPASGAVIVALRRRPFGRVLATAASLIVVFGLGTAVLTRGGGESVPESAPIPPAALTRAPEAPDAAFGPRLAKSGVAETPEGATAMVPNLRRNATMAAPNVASAPEAKAAPAAPLAAPGAPAAIEAAPDASTSARSAPGATPLDQAVACARAILIGRVLSVTTDGRGTTLTLRVDEWITPAAGPTSISYAIGGLDATTDNGPAKLMVGQRRLFVVPRSSSAPAYDFAGPDFAAARAEVARAQRRAAGSC